MSPAPPPFFYRRVRGDEGQRDLGLGEPVELALGIHRRLAQALQCCKVVQVVPGEVDARVRRCFRSRSAAVLHLQSLAVH